MPAPVVHLEMPRLSRNYSFHFLWSSTLASGFADRLAMLAVAVMLGQGVVKGALSQVRLADSSIMAAINFWFFLPYVLWGPFAGWLADRLPRKWLMFVADEARGVIILGAYWLIPAGSSGTVPGLYETWKTIDLLGWTFTLDHTWKVWGLMFAIGMFAATFTPARNSVIPNVVGYASLQRANSVVIGMGVIGNLIGFGVGGPLAEKVVHTCILLSALSYLGPGWMWPFLKTPVRRHDRPGLVAERIGPIRAMGQIVDGGHYILRHHPVLVLTIVSVLFWGGSHVIMAAGSAIAVHLYGGTITDFAMIGGGFGVGMFLGAISLGIINSRFGSEVILVVAMIGVAIFLSLLAVIPSLYAGVAISIAMGYFGGLILITANTLIQQFTADGYRGRVMGFKDLVSDFAGVAISFIIWRMANADDYILHITHLFSLLMLVAALWGTWRYVMHGPAPGRWLNLLWRVDRLYAGGFHHLKTSGAHHVPSTGPVLLVCKHTAGIDPLLIQSAARRPIRWMMAAEYMHGWMRWLWCVIEPIPVKRDGSDRNAARQAITALQAGEVVGIFPEGRLPQHRDRIEPFGPGVALVASRSGATIVPVWISGTPHTRSVAGSFCRPSSSHITFGRPFSIDDLQISDPHDRRAVTDAIASRIEALSRHVAPTPPPPAGQIAS